ncbi:hypothetical protein ACOMHN_051511 [Nucella lapillus]
MSLSGHQKLTEEMRQSTRERFPNLRHQTYFVPPIRANKTKYQRLNALSTNRHDVMEQRELQAATLLGDQTEDTISRCLSEVMRRTQEAMCVLSNYQYDDYLFLLEHKSGPRSGSDLASRMEATARKNSSEMSHDVSTDSTTSAGVRKGKRKSKTLSESSSDSDVVVMLQNPAGLQSGLKEDREDPLESQNSGDEREKGLKGHSSPCPSSRPEESSDESVRKGPFPTPKDLESSLKRGDFDSLIISSRLGFVVIEAKTLLGLETIAPHSEHPHASQTCSERDGHPHPKNDHSSSLPDDRDGDLVQVGKPYSPVGPHNGSTEDLPGVGGEFKKFSAVEHFQTQQEENRLCQSGSLKTHIEPTSANGRKHPKGQKGDFDDEAELICKSDNDSDEPETEDFSDSSEHSQIGTTYKTLSANQHKGHPDSANQHKGHPDSPNQREDDDFRLSSSSNSDHESSVTSGKRASMEEDFRKTISKSLNQLRKAKRVLRHLTSDLPGRPAITKVLALPNTSRGQLRQLLDHPDLGKDCCEVLETKTVEEALERCLTSEQVEENELATDISPGDTTAEVMTPLMQWWSNLEHGIVSRRELKTVERSPHMLEENEEDNEEFVEAKTEMSWDVYEQIVSRFCGPFSRLKSRTAADCIHLTGVDFGRSILRQEQLRLLDCPSRFFCLTGPPGSGKTLMLALKAEQWARQGDKVVVVRAAGVDWGSLISWTLYNRVHDSLHQHRRDQIRRGEARTRPCTACPDTLTPDRRRPPSHKRKKAKSRPLQPSPPSVASLQDWEGPSCAEREGEGGGGEECIHQVEIRRETDVDHFVDSLLKEHRGSNLRVIVDERPRHVTVDSTFDHLSEAGKDLEEMRRIYIAIRDKVSGLSDSGQEKQNVDVADTARSGTLPRTGSEVEDRNTQGIREPEGSESKTSVSNVERERKMRANLQERLEEKNADEDLTCSLDTTTAANSDSSLEMNATKKVPRNPDYPSTQGLSPLVVNPPITGCVPCVDDLTRDPPESSAQEDHRAKKPTLGERSEICMILENETSPTQTGQNADHSPSPTQTGQNTDHSPSLTQNGQNADHSPSLTQTGQNADHSLSPTQTGQNADHSPQPQKEGAKESGHSDHPGKGDHFTAMEDRMRKLERRFSLMQPKACGGPDIIRSPQWRESLKVLDQRFNEVRSLMTDVAPKVLRCALPDYLEFVDSLEELSRLMVSTMGHMYHACLSLTFFQVEQLFATLRRVASPASFRDSRQSNEISVWSASVYSHYIPEGYERGLLTHSIRCPPTVQRILQWTEADTSHAAGYSYITRGCDVSPPLPSDGPPVTWVDHLRHSQSDSEINDCAECGQALADHLIDTLGVKRYEPTKGRRGKGQGQQNQLYFHDVIICGSPIHKPECAFIQAMAQRDIVFEVERDTLKSPPPYKDKMFIIGGTTVQGVEAKIVVYVPELKRITDAEKATSSVTSAVPRQSPDPMFPDRASRDSGKNNSYDSHNRHVSQSLNVPQNSDVLQKSDVSQSYNVPHNLGVPENSNLPQNLNFPQNSDVPQNSDAPQNSDKLQIPQNSTNLSQKSSEVPPSSAVGWSKGEKYSRSDVQERERLRRLGAWNRHYIWHVASRSVSHLIVFHV